MWSRKSLPHTPSYYGATPSIEIFLWLPYARDVQILQKSRRRLKIIYAGTVAKVFNKVVQISGGPGSLSRYSDSVRGGPFGNPI